MPRLLTRLLQRRRLLQVASKSGAVLLAAPLAACDETPLSVIAPWTGPPETVQDLRLAALSWASLAPSPHNSQPWLARLVRGNAILVGLDRSRRLQVVDPAARQALVGLGAFLELVALAAGAHGSAADVGLPAGEAPEAPLATVRLRGGGTPDPLFAALPHRRSTKLAYDLEKPITPVHAQALVDAAGADVRVGLATDAAQVAALRDVVWSAFEIEYTLTSALGEMAGWTRLGAAEVAARPDGLALTGTSVWWLRRLGLLSRASLARPGSLAWRVGRLQWENLIAGTASFGWLVTDDDDLASRIAAGRAYQRVDLAAAAAGVAIHPVSQALGDYAEQAEPRRRLEAILGIGPPARTQMLFRLGYAGPEAPSPRRPLTAIVRL